MYNNPRSIQKDSISTIPVRSHLIAVMPFKCIMMITGLVVFVRLYVWVFYAMSGNNVDFLKKKSPTEKRRPLKIKSKKRILCANRPEFSVGGKFKSF